MRVPDGWKLVPIEATAAMLEAARLLDSHGFGAVAASNHDLALSYRAALAAAPPAPQDPEIANGVEAEGLAGAMYRLLDRCDYRVIDGWLKAEIVRGTPQNTIIKTMAGMIASCALQVAGLTTRSQMPGMGRAIMIEAALILHRDIAALVQAKKDDTVLHRNIRVVPSGG